MVEGRELFPREARELQGNLFSSLGHPENRSCKIVSMNNKTSTSPEREMEKMNKKVKQLEQEIWILDFLEFEKPREVFSI